MCLANMLRRYLHTVSRVERKVAKCQTLYQHGPVQVVSHLLIWLPGPMDSFHLRSYQGLKLNIRSACVSQGTMKASRVH